MILKKRFKDFLTWWLFICSPIFLMLQACAKSEFGRQLADSFDSDPAVPSVDSPTIKSEQKKKSTILKAKRNKNIQPKISIQKPSPTPKNDRLKNDRTSSLAITSQPYRITIKLSMADPSAPAEVVTKALRLAGVTFEVEMIERIESKNSRESQIDRLGVRR